MRAGTSNRTMQSPRIVLPLAPLPVPTPPERVEPMLSSLSARGRRRSRSITRMRTVTAQESEGDGSEAAGVECLSQMRLGWLGGTSLIAEKFSVECGLAPPREQLSHQTPGKGCA